MGDAEPIKKVKEGNLCLHSDSMRDDGHINSLLHRMRAQQSNARLTSCKNITIVTVDIHRLTTNRARRNVKHCRLKLSRNLKQFRNHKQ
jgi:hypothetical protein